MATKIWTGATSGDWATAGNWDGGVPANSDDVILDNNAVDVDEGLDQSGVQLASLTITQSYTGRVGTAAAYLQIGATKVSIGSYSGPGYPGGSGRICLDVGTEPATIEVHDTSSSPTETYLPPVRIKAADAATTVHVRKGRVGLACVPGETSTVASVNVSYSTNPASDAEVVIGSGVTMATLNQTGGVVTLQAAATTINLAGGTLHTRGSGAITTLNVSGGACYASSTGTITNANVQGSSTTGSLDFTRSTLARTVTNLKLSAGGQVAYDPAVLTVTTHVAPTSAVRVAASAA